MTATQWHPRTHFHFIGIGGQSMSGLARALALQGYTVTGSDIVNSERIARLRAEGVGVVLGHDAATTASLPPDSVVVLTTDVPADNAERLCAQSRGLQVVHRSEVLNWFMEGGRRPGQVSSVAVTGTHGKTTTTALTGYFLRAGDCDPRFPTWSVLAERTWSSGRGP